MTSFLACFRPAYCTEVDLTRYSSWRECLGPAPGLRRLSPSCRLSDFVQTAAHLENQVRTEPRTTQTPLGASLVL